jgi:molybdenum cofactor cytidylyltransferase
MGTPKALLEYRGETFLDRLIRVLGAVTDPVIVVLGHHLAPILEKSTRAGVLGHAQFVINPQPERGQFSSLQSGLLQLPPEAQGFAFIPLDCPAVREETVARLAQTFLERDPKTLLVIPRCKDERGGHPEVHRGHPVFASRAIAEEILALPSEAQARDVIHRHVSRTQYVDVDDRGICTDIDDPAAYLQLLEESGGGRNP